MAESYEIVTHAFFAVTALVGSQLLDRWTLEKSGVVLLLFVLYATAEDRCEWIRGAGPLLRHVWLLAGHVLTFIVVQDALVRVRGELRHVRDPSYGDALAGMLVLLFVLPLYRFNPVRGTHVVRTVMVTLALHFSGILLVVVTRPTLCAYTVGIALNAAALLWLHWNRTHRGWVADVYADLFDQIGVFLVARWALFVYRLGTAHQAPHLVGSFLVIGATLVFFAELWTRHSIHVSTVHGIIEAFVFFLSLTFIPDVLLTHTQLVTLVCLGVVAWLATRACRRWLLVHKIPTVRSLLYMVNLAMRVITYVLIQTLVPFMRRRLADSTNALEWVVMYLVLVLFASQFMWRSYVDVRIDPRSAVEPTALL